MTGLFAADLRVRDEVRVDVRLDPRERYLADHDIGTGSLLSTVLSIEALASALCALHPDARVTAIEDVVVGPPLFVREPLVARATVREVGDGRYEVALGSAAGPHLSAQLVTGAPSERSMSAPGDDAGPAVDAAAIYGLFFHGPAFRVVGRARWSGGALVGELSTGRPPLHEPVGRTATAPLLVELCLQTCGLWQLASLGEMAIPLSIDRIVRRTDLEADGGAGLRAVVRPARDEGGRLHFDADVVDDHGRVHVGVRGYRGTGMAGGVDPAAASGIRTALSGVPAI